MWPGRSIFSNVVPYWCKRSGALHQLDSGVKPRKYTQCKWLHPAGKDSFGDLIQTLVPAVGKHLIVSFYKVTRKKRLPLLWRNYVSVALVEEGEDPPTGPPTFVFKNWKDIWRRAERWAVARTPEEQVDGWVWVIIYCLLFTVYCSIERTSKWLNRKKKKKKLRGTNTLHKRNADENFMQQNKDARERFSIWCFNGRQPGAYGQSSLMLLFCLFCFLRRGTVPPYCYRLFITASVCHF